MENIKICNGCNKQKDINLFIKNPTAKSGVGAKCKECKNSLAKNARKDPSNFERFKEYSKKYRNSEKGKIIVRKMNARPENIKRRSKLIRIWEENNPDKLKIQQKKAYVKRKENPISNFADKIRHGLIDSFHVRNFVKKNKTFTLLNYNQIDLKNHLEKWLNKPCEDCNNIVLELKTASLDHIIPTNLASDENELIILNQLFNLRLICGSCNSRKNDKICLPIQQTLLESMRSKNILIKKLQN